MDTNLAVISGRVGNQPTMQYSFKGHAMLVFDVAVHRRSGRGGILTTWIPVLAWGKLAEALTPMVQAGDHVMVTGSFESPPRVVGELPDGRRPHELIAKRVVVLGKSCPVCEGGADPAEEPTEYEQGEPVRNS
jgi:hypothetical protein